MEKEQNFQEENIKRLNLLNIADIEELTGWSRPTVLKLMDREDFPAIKIGKENLVCFDALYNYLQVRREIRG